MRTTDITVRYSTGAYVTNTVYKLRASNTASAEAAAAALGRKLYGAAFDRVALVAESAGSAMPSTWRIHAQPVEVC